MSKYEQDFLTGELSRQKYLFRRQMTAETPYTGAGTAFPTINIAAGDRFFRTDFDSDFFYTGSAWKQHTIPDWSGSFPGSPLTNMRVFRSDRGGEYYYDGSRWLTTQIYHLAIIPRDAPGTSGFTQGTHLWDITIPLSPNSGVYVIGLYRTMYMFSTQSGVNYYSWDFRLPGAVVFSAPTNTSALTANSDQPQTDTYNQAVTTTFQRLQLQCTANGSPGLFQCTATVAYRLIG